MTAAFTMSRSGSRRIVFAWLRGGVSSSRPWPPTPRINCLALAGIGFGPSRAYSARRLYSFPQQDYVAVGRPIRGPGSLLSSSFVPALLLNQDRDSHERGGDESAAFALIL